MAWGSKPKGTKETTRGGGKMEKWLIIFGVRKKDAKILACTLSIHHTTRASNFSGIERETLTRSDARPPISHPNDALVGPKGTAHLENISNWLHSAIHLNLRQKNTILQVVNIRLRNQRHKWIQTAHGLFTPKRTEMIDISTLPSGATRKEQGRLTTMKPRTWPSLMCQCEPLQWTSSLAMTHPTPEKKELCFGYVTTSNYFYCFSVSKSFVPFSLSPTDVFGVSFTTVTLTVW